VDERSAGQAEDQKLLASFAGGDRAALGELATRYERPLLGLALGLLGSRELAEEAVQDSWVRVVRAAGQFKEKSSVRTWLYRIVINRSRDIARRERSQRVRLNGKTRPGEAGGSPAADTETRAAVRQAVGALSAVEREAVLLCHHADLTHTQAAEILQVPLGTLKSRVRSGLSRLERSLRSEVEV
jgi:RNA polymerase sigma-70 factor (ECF subfamily)